MSGEGVDNPIDIASFAFYLKHDSGELVIIRSFQSFPPVGFEEILNIYLDLIPEELVFIV